MYIVGQEAARQRLRSMLSSGRIAHALLFAGPEGAGALPLALRLAQRLLCEHPTTEQEPCGSCPACSKAERFVHPDLHVIFPIVKMRSSDDTLTYLPAWRDQVARQPYFSLSDWTRQMQTYVDPAAATDTTAPATEPAEEELDDPDAPAATPATAAAGTAKQALIARDAATTVHRQLALKPVEADRQIMIIYKPELMNESTSNALLKLLEEPPLDTLFLLVSEAPGELLPTIRSRVQCLPVPPLSETEISDALRERHYIEPRLADRLAHMARGSWTEALRLADPPPDEQDNLALFKELVRAPYNGDLTRMASLADRLRALGREQLKAILTYALRLLREAFVMNLGEPRLNYLSEEEEAFLANFAIYVHLGNARQLNGLLTQTLLRLEQNGNPRMLLRGLLYDMAAVFAASRQG